MTAASEPKKSRASPHDAFGRVCSDPARLSFSDRVNVLRTLVGRMQASSRQDEAWLGRSIHRWMAEGGDMVEQLGLRAVRGSRSTPQQLLRRDRQRFVIRRLVGIAGTVERARRMAIGELVCPDAATDVLAEFHELRCGTSKATFNRAMRARHRP